MPNKKGLFSDDISPNCAYCENATKLQDNNFVLCKDKGVVACDHSCKKFVYDPLKRIPHRAKLHSEYSAEDFSIE